MTAGLRPLEASAGSTILPTMNMHFARITGGCLAVVTSTALGGCGPRGPVEGPELQSDASIVEYPVELWDMGIEGETTVMMHVTAEGEVDSTYVDLTSGIPDFDSAAIQAGRRMRFSPARRDGERVAAWTRVPIRFQRTRERPGVDGMSRESSGQGEK